MNQSVPYSQILDFLSEQIDTEASGTLFVRTECNHAITIALERGQINGIYFGARQGRKAIPLISKVLRGSYRFEETGFATHPQDLPSTPEILDLLGATQNLTAPTGSAISRQEIIEEKNKTALCDKLRALLAEYIGPIANFVFDDAADDDASSCATTQAAQELINKLSEEIGSPEDVRQFRTEASALINEALRQ